MIRRRLVRLLLGASLWTSSAGAQEQPRPIVEVSHERALGLARAPSAGARDVSLAELLAYAERHAPAVRLATRRQRRGEAARAGAAPLLSHNPTLSFGVGPRLSDAFAPDFDFVASLTLPLEVAGERGLRLYVASQLDQRLRAETTAARWELRRDVILCFHTAAAARARVTLAERAARFAKEMLGVARRRLAAGDGTAIEVRIAETDVAQARQAKLAAELELRTSRIRLAEHTGWSLERPPSVPAVLPPPRHVPTLAVLLALAHERHPGLRVYRTATAEAGARVALAKREAWPAPTFGVQVAREGATGSPANYIVLGSVGVPLPLWQRNQGRRERQRVAQEIASAEESIAARAIRARITRAHAELVTASRRLALFSTGVAPQLEHSLELLRRGFTAGELPLLEVALARERFLSAQRDLLSARADYQRALARLEFAVGAELSQVSPTGGLPR